MGCGQSKIGIIYPRKSKSKGGSKRSGKFVNLRVFRLRKKKSSHKNKQRVDPDSDEEAEEADPGPVQDVAEPEPEESEETDDQEKTNLTGNRHILPAGGPLLAQTEISSSQMDFFRMLDEKIENGPDYDSANEEEIAQERARLLALLKDWETASNNSSLTRSAPTTPAHRKLPAKPTNVPSSLPQYYHHPHVNGDLYYQQQQQQQQQYQYQQQQSYFQHHMQQQYQPPPPHLHRGQYVMPPPPPQMTRVAPVMMRTYPMMPQQPSTAIVQYRQSRGAYTELA